jgi:hypothetical protein
VVEATPTAHAPGDLPADAAISSRTSASVLSVMTGTNSGGARACSYATQQGLSMTLTPMPGRRMTWPQIVPICPWQPLEKKGGEERCPGTLSVGPRPCCSQLGWSPHWCSFGERLVFSYHAADRDRPRCRHRCGHSPTTVCSLGDCSSYLAGGTSLPSSARPSAKFELSHTRI